MRKLITLITILVLSGGGCFTTQNQPQQNQSTSGLDVIDVTIKCEELYNIKKERYWGDELGQSKTVYNEEMDTCLALNIYNDFEADSYFASIKNLQNDANILWYSEDTPGFYYDEDGKKVECEYSYTYFEYLEDNEEKLEYGCEQYGLFDKMFEKIRSYGFVVFDGFETR
jgi:hypothetical protein